VRRVDNDNIRLLEFNMLATSIVGMTQGFPAPSGFRFILWWIFPVNKMGRVWGEPAAQYGSRFRGRIFHTKVFPR